MKREFATASASQSPPPKVALQVQRFVLTSEVKGKEPVDELATAAALMWNHDCGVIVVVDTDGAHIAGMVTDRDITVRGVAAGLMPDTACVAEVMTTTLEFCTEDQDTEEVMRTMGQAQVRRLPVVNMEGELVGIVSLGDMARRQPGHIDQTVREISEPSN